MYLRSCAGVPVPLTELFATDFSKQAGFESAVALGPNTRLRGASPSERAADILDLAFGHGVRNRQSDNSTRNSFRDGQCARDTGLLEERLLGQMRDEIASGTNAAAPQGFDDLLDPPAVAIGH